VTISTYMYASSWNK